MKNLSPKLGSNTGGKKCWLNLCVSLALVIAANNLMAQTPPPACNIQGPLVTCANHNPSDTTRDFLIYIEVARSTPTPTISYSFASNTAGAFIRKDLHGTVLIPNGNAVGVTTARASGSYRTGVNVTYDTLVVFPGTRGYEFNLEVNVTTQNTINNACECSKSVSVSDISATLSYPSIPCNGGTTRLSVLASGASQDGQGSVLYFDSLYAGGIVFPNGLVSTPNPNGGSSSFSNVTAGNYLLTIYSNVDECRFDTLITINQAQANPLNFNCPEGLVVPYCQTQQDVNTQFSNWLLTVGLSGGVNPVLTNNSNNIAPSSCGGTKDVIFTVTSDCEVPQSCSSTFAVADAPAFTLNCPAPQTEAPGQTQAAINAKFAQWLASISYSGGCNPQITDNHLNPPDVCGGSVTVTWTATSDCAPTQQCTSTFSISSCYGSIGDFVWYDMNADGVQDAGEPGIPGVTVTLTSNCTGTMTTTTDASGHYLFSNLQPCSYCVSFGPVPGFDLTTPNAVGVSDSLDSDPLMVGSPVCVNLALAENNLTLDAGFVATSCYEPCDTDTRVGAIQSITQNRGAGTVTIKVTFNKQFVDNTYGTNAIGWPNGHRFSDLTGSDHLQMALYDINHTKQLEFKLDYISTDATRPSGYGSLGVLGGDGAMLYGSSSNIVKVRTSMDVNFNTFGYVLTANSPATNASYTPNPTYPNWIYEVWYEVTVKTSAFPGGFDSVGITGIHASPSKTGNSTACVQPCRPPSLSVTANSGACGTTCRGTIDATVTHGRPPFRYSWAASNGGIVPAGQEHFQDLNNLCAGTYSLTLTDLIGTQVTAQANILATSPCPPSICYESCTGNPAVGAVQTVTDNGSTLTIRTTFSKTFVDNTYGTSAIGWPNGHRFSDLTGSDHVQLALYDANNVKKMEFKIDYISSSSTVPSGYKSLGVSGGDGGMVSGNAADVVSCLTSLDVNFNTYGYVLTTNSPVTDASYTPNATYPNWIYDVWYEVTVKKSAFGTAGFGKPVITDIHASPSKTGNNTECVQNCLPLSVDIKASNGYCGSTCASSINLTVSHGQPPYSYAWSAGSQSFSSTNEDLQNLCSGTYTVTVTDAAGTQVTAQASVADPPAGCVNQTCFANSGNPVNVNAQSTWTFNLSSQTVTIRTTLAKTFVDNTYGTNAIGWTSCGSGGHKFNDLVGSDKLQLALYDANNVKKIEFKMDYISASNTVPSGYKSLGVTGGDGGMILGNASDVVSVTTSLDRNFNAYGYVLTTNSPATNASYAPNSTYPNWIYDVWYEVTVKLSVFGSAGFGSPAITTVHASPSKVCQNDETVTVVPCVNNKTDETSEDRTANDIANPQSQLNVYPNPASDIIQVIFSTAEATHSNLKMYDMDGRVVAEIYHGDTTSGEMYQLTFDTQGLADGVYFITLHTGAGIIVKKLLIQK